MKESKRKLEWCRVRKNIRFLILFIPRSSDCKKKLFLGFSEILIHKISHEFTSFSIFYLTKKSTKKYLKFQQHSLLTALHKKSAYAHNEFFGFGFCASLQSVGLMKSKIVKVKSFYNHLTHHFPAITEFPIVWATLLYIIHQAMDKDKHLVLFPTPQSFLVFSSKQLYHSHIYKHKNVVIQYVHKYNICNLHMFALLKLI